MSDVVYILPAEYIGEARVEDGMLTIGTVGDDGEGAVKLRMDGWCGSVAVYVRRLSSDLSISEIHMAHHDGLAQEELDQENLEAERFPLGPKEYWRGKMVGKYTYGADHHLMTNEEFEADWDEGDADDD